jgi:hypothetical protein
MMVWAIVGRTCQIGEGRNGGLSFVSIGGKVKE